MPHYPKPFFRKDRKLWYVQLDGRQINLGPVRTAAFVHYRDLMAAPRAVATVTPVASTLVVVLCDKFLDWVQLHRAAATYQWYWWRLQSFVRKYPELTAEELRPFHVQEWVDAQNIATTTQRNCIRAVKRCIRWAHRQGYITANPLSDLEAPSAERREIVVSETEYSQILTAIRDPGFYDLIVTTWETGCRPQESLRVEARHVDLKNQRWVFPKSESKTRQVSRVVYLTDEALQITRRLMVASPAGSLFRNARGAAWTNYAVQCAFRRIRARLGRTKLRHDGIVVSDKDIAAFIPSLASHRKQAGTAIAKSAKELCAEAERKLTERLAVRQVPKYSLYSLRHSWATRALQQGVDSLTVAILMGHKDPSMLARVYQHLGLNPQHLLRELKRVAG